MAEQPGGGGGILARSGLDSIKLGGHKVPIALIAGVIALVGVIAILRARSTGSSASVGAAPSSSPYTAASSGFGTQGFSPDYSGALANLSAQLTSLGQGLNSPASTPAPTVAPSPVSLIGGGPQGTWDVPLSLTPGGAPIWVKAGSQVTLAGAPVAGTYAGQTLLAEPVNYLGGQFFANVQNLPPTAMR